MPRAYLRLDPGYDEHKESYPDGPYAALVACFCQGEFQPERGRFRNERYLKALLGVRGRHVGYLIEHGDLIRLDDGRLYIVGWDEWQEGDWKVRERVGRIRSRKRNGVTHEVTVPTVTPTVTDTVTPTVTGDTALRQSVIDSGSGSGSGSGSTEAQEPERARAPVTRNKMHSTASILKGFDLRDISDDTRLTKAQLDAWSSFGSEWDRFKAAWFARGLKWPPAGSPDDDPEAASPSQRALLYSILDSRPTDLPRWVAEAPGKTAASIVGYVLSSWHSIRDAVPADRQH